MSLKEKQYELIQDLINIAEELGWNLATFKSESEGEPTPGLIMGSPEFFKEIHLDENQLEEYIEFDSVAQKSKGNLH